jgi:hypothetical protein
VHAYVDQKVMRYPHLKVIFAPFFTYDELVTSGVHPQQPKQQTNTTTMVMEPLTPPAAWIWWFHAAQGAGGLAHILSKVAIEGFK